MKTLALNRESWHYWLATFFGWKESYTVWRHNPDAENWHDNVLKVRIYNDFCSYVRRILCGCVLGLLVIIVASLFTWGIILAEYQFFVHMVYEHFILNQPLDFKTNGLAPIGLIINVLGSIILFALSIKEGWITVFALPSWLKWCFFWIPEGGIRIPNCDNIPLCDDTRRFLVAAYTMFHDKVCFKLSFHQNGVQENDQ